MDKGRQGWVESGTVSLRRKKVRGLEVEKVRN